MKQESRKRRNEAANEWRKKTPGQGRKMSCSIWDSMHQLLHTTTLRYCINFNLRCCSFRWVVVDNDRLYRQHSSVAVKYEWILSLAPFVEFCWSFISNYLYMYKLENDQRWTARGDTYGGPIVNSEKAITLRFLFFTKSLGPMYRRVIPEYVHSVNFE